MKETPLTIAAFVVAILGLGLAVASLVWQIAQHVLTGSVVRVRTGEGFLVDRHLNLQDRVVQVEVVNKGRVAVAINSWGLRLPNGMQMFPDASGAMVPPGTPRAPQTLEPGHSVTFMSLRSQVQLAGHVDQELEFPFRVQGFVNLGNGKRRVHRRGLRIDSSTD